MLVFPKMIKPASISFCAMPEFFAAFAPRKAKDPAVVGMPSSCDVTKQS